MINPLGFFLFAAIICLSGSLAAQNQNVTSTGLGEAMKSANDIQKKIQQYWDGRTGELLKGTVGLAQAAAALSAAKQAVTFKGVVRRDGSCCAASGLSIESFTQEGVIDTSSATSTK